MTALLINSGSSSLKFHLASLADHSLIASGNYDWAGQKCRFQLQGTKQDIPFRGAFQCFHHLLGELRQKFQREKSALKVAAHRVVHGGDLTTASVLDDRVIAAITKAAGFAPLHNPPALEVIAAARASMPKVMQVACFDTAFHASMDPRAFTYPIPSSWSEKLGLRRFGFHGLNVAWCAQRAREFLPARSTRLVVCHLGHGASASAVMDGKSVFTTMGLTPLDGLMMGTRSGSIDPGIIFHLARVHNLPAEEIEKALLKESGLLGVSGKSADMREVISLAAAGDVRASLAIDMYCLRVQQAIGALTATMGGLDAVIFTAGVGENAALIREKIIEPLKFLGLEIDPARNQSCQGDMDIATASASARVLVLAAREELQMLKEAQKLLAPGTEN